MKPKKTQKLDAPPPPVPPADGARPDPKWPVEKAADLTLDHIPPHLRDAIARPYIRAGHVLGQFAHGVMDVRNDLMNGLQRLEKEGNKDSGALNQTLASPEFLSALQTVGLAPTPPREAPKQPRG